MLAVAGNAAELNIGQGVLAAGKPAAVNVTLASAGAALAGVQFDLEYDAAVFNVTAETGPAAAQAGKSVQSAPVAAGKLRVLIVGLNRNTMSDGVVAVLQVSLKGAVGASRSFPLRITVPVGTTAAAQSVRMTGSDGSVKVESGGNGQ